MESPQSVVSPFNTSSAYSAPKNPNLDLFTKTPNFLTKEPEPFIGILEVYIHQARDIQNICIYQKQDVYAKICLTTNPEKAVTTQTINGGGKNPIFNETLKLNVPKIDSSLKCEIFMLSRVRNYLEDQLLGFALIPLSEILIKNGKLEKEFVLSSTDLFHSPAGFVDLSLSYAGASPEVIAIPPPPAANGTTTDSEPPKPESSEFERIEFPDPNLANENDIMVSEYFGLSSESLVSSDTDDQPDGSGFGFSNAVENPKPESPPTSVSTNGSECAFGPVITTKSANQEFDSPLKGNPAKDGDSESRFLGGGPITKNVVAVKEKPTKDGDSESRFLGGGPITKNVVAVNVKPDKEVVQQDFVDLYMKSMQQFTESLAKMKLPLDVEKERADSGNSSSDQKITTPNSTQSRVFYGSRAFF